MPRLIVMLRVKDGIDFVDEWLACFEKLADEIVVLDNGSTDGTFEALSAHPKVTEIIRTEGFNEGRDKNLLYAHVRTHSPDWCIWVDIDEIFEPGLTRQHFDRLMNAGGARRYAFRRFHFIDRDNFAASWFRLNYSSGHDRVMWKESTHGYFEDLLIDSPNVKGIKGWKRPTNFRIKHLGYINKTLVDRKADLYRTIIPGKESIFQEMYMRNERPRKWNDDRNSFDVRSLTVLLDLLLLKQWSAKAINKIGSLFTSRVKPNEAPQQQLTRPAKSMTRP